MATIKDLAKVLISRHRITGKDAESFMQSFVETINEGLIADRQVKIKGFGTFKVQAMKERSSVNISTGERVVIGEHDKITFTPDSLMRDIINKPFAQFETVIVDDNSPLLNESMEIYDESVECKNTEISPSIVQSDVTGKSETLTPKEDIPVVKDEIRYEEQQEELPNEVQEPVNGGIKPVTESLIPELEESTSPEVESSTNEDEIADKEADNCLLPSPPCRNIFVYYGIIINIVVAAIAFWGGFFAAKQQWFGFDEPKQSVETAVSVKPTSHVGKKVVERDSTKHVQNIDSSTVTLAPAMPTTNVKAEVTEPKTTSPQPLRGYDTDARVRTGAYYIMGTAQTVTVKEGQTLKGISRTYLGPDMECYIEAYNNTKEVKTGDKIKIPELKLKKLLRK